MADTIGPRLPLAHFDWRPNRHDEVPRSQMIASAVSDQPDPIEAHKSRMQQKGRRRSAGLVGAAATARAKAAYAWAAMSPFGTSPTCRESGVTSAMSGIANMRQRG